MRGLKNEQTCPCHQGGSASRGWARRGAEGKGWTVYWKGASRLPTLFPLLTLAVALPHHDITPVTCTVVGALRVGALPSTAHSWLLTLIHICEDTGKS